MMEKKRYAQVGIGSRARMYYEALASTFKDMGEYVGMCDQSQTRMNYANRQITEKYGMGPVPTYLAQDFEKMIEETKPDYVIVTTVDRTHDDYICRAMRAGCDVITEKPLTIDERKAQRILDCQKETGKHVRVMFNYRYAPYNTKVRELIRDGVIGEVFSVHFEWMLNTKHGADYYRRWHRNKLNSGGLLVHKATHHFDLVNFWLDSMPETVFAFGSLNFYGRHNAERRGVTDFYYRAYGSEYAKNDPFALDIYNNPQLKGIYFDAEEDSGYIRDRSVFSDDISIEDTMGVIARYKSGAILTYSLNTYMPWEGYNVSFNGSKGRIEYHVVERPYVNGEGDKANEGAAKVHRIVVNPMFGEPYEAPVVLNEGGHGGGDPVMLNDLFNPDAPEDEFHRAADTIDGIKSILLGIAANKSIASGLPVQIDSLVRY